MEPTTKTERDFPKGMRVRLSEAGKEALNVLGNRSGVVVGLSRSSYVRVRWDGNSEPNMWHTDFLEPDPR